MVLGDLWSIYNECALLGSKNLGALGSVDGRSFDLGILNTELAADAAFFGPLAPKQPRRAVIIG